MEVEVVESLDMQHAPFEDCASQFYSLLGHFICFSSIFFYDSIPDFIEKKGNNLRAVGSSEFWESLSSILKYRRSTLALDTNIRFDFRYCE